LSIAAGNLNDVSSGNVPDELSFSAPSGGTFRGLATPSSSIFLCQHDGDHALGHLRIGRVGRVHCQALVVIVDFEKDPLPVGIERAKVVLLVRVVGVAKVVVDLTQAPHSPCQLPTAALAAAR
jgi:hypothetical protein